MKKTIYLLTGLVFLVCMRSISLAEDNKKLAQTGFQFLSVISDAKAAGMAGAVNSLEIGSGSLFFNPACLAGLNRRVEVTASMNNWIADIKHLQFSMAVNLTPGSDNLGVFGLSFQNVDYGEILSTTVDPDVNSTKGYFDIGSIFPQAYSVGIGYAKKLSDRFSVGGQIKYVSQDLGQSIVPGDSLPVKESFDLKPMAFDFGTLFKTGIKSLAFGMSVRHFSKEIRYVEEGFQLPLIFTLGISMDVMEFVEQAKPNHSLIVSVDATHDRSYQEQLLIGMNYTFMNMLSIRAGYISGDDLEDVSFGFGVSQFGFDLDYGYTPYSVFGNIQRMTARFKL